ncbi:MAG: DUF2721 domain-containing protein [Flavobacteriales bacterium]
MDITINTPALLFPAISLVMLAYTNRFMALSSVVRQLHDRYKKNDEAPNLLLHAQIKSLRFRLRLVKNMQILGVSSFLVAIFCMGFIYFDKMEMARITFAISIILFAASLIFSLVELFQSTHSLELELSDVEDPDSGLLEYLKNKLKV